MKNGWPKLGGLLGIAYCIAGFFLIFLGWNGAASHDREPAQIPYVISGGIAGLGLVVLGAALIVAHSLRTDRVELRGVDRRPARRGRAPGRRPVDGRRPDGRRRDGRLCSRTPRHAAGRRRAADPSENLRCRSRSRDRGR